MVNNDNHDNLARGNGHIKCIQINLGRRRRATNNFADKIVRDNIKIAFIQEPYVINGKVCGLFGQYKSFYIGDNNEAIRAAIVITDKELKGVLLRDKSNANIITVEIQNSRGLKIIAASYFHPEERHPGKFQDNLRELRRVKKRIRTG